MNNPEHLTQRFRSRVHVVDGGLATELEKRGYDISGKLWSAQVLLDDPGAIEQLHYDYLKAGADIIITGSYQLTFQGMKEAGYSHTQAEDALRQSVEVAVKARARYSNELDENLPEDRLPLIAASIGPYGAYLADGSEYRGNYGLSTDKLRAFHRERFELLAGSGADLIAFETTPDTEEVHAYFSLLESHPHTAAWITASRAEAAKAALDFRENIAIHNIVALGANCIPPGTVPEMIRLFGADAIAVPIIVYPNSGQSWDAGRRRWTGEYDAGQFAGHAREWIKAGAKLVGGCCGTSPEHIARMRGLLN